MSKNTLAVISFLAIALIVSPVFGYGPFSALISSNEDVTAGDSGAGNAAGTVAETVNGN